MEHRKSQAQIVRENAGATVAAANKTSKKTGGKTMKVTVIKENTDETAELREQRLRQLGLDTSSGEDSDDIEDHEETVALLNVEAKQHSRILEVMPRNCNDQKFFFEKPHNDREEIIYLLPSFTLDDDTVNREIRSMEWKNSSVIMPLDFIFFTQKTRIEELFERTDHPISMYWSIEKKENRDKLVHLFGLNKTKEPLEYWKIFPQRLQLVDVHSTVSNTHTKITLFFTF